MRHAVDLARAALALGADGHLTVRHSTRRLPEMEFDGYYSPREAIEELMRFTTLFETEEGLALLVRRIKRDAGRTQARRPEGHHSPDRADAYRGPGLLNRSPLVVGGAEGSDLEVRRCKFGFVDLSCPIFSHACLEL